MPYIIYSDEANPWEYLNNGYNTDHLYRSLNKRGEDENCTYHTKSRGACLCRSTGRQESEQLLGTIVGQYRRLISTTAVRAQSMCTLARVDLSCEGCGEAQTDGHEAAGGVEAGEKSTVDVLTAGTGLGT